MVLPRSELRLVRSPTTTVPQTPDPQLRSRWFSFADRTGSSAAAVIVRASALPCGRRPEPEPLLPPPEASQALPRPAGRRHARQQESPALQGFHHGRYREALALGRSIDSRRSIITSLGVLACIAAARGEASSAGYPMGDD
jgi:hypothetical protein